MCGLKLSLSLTLFRFTSLVHARYQNEIPLAAVAVACQRLQSQHDSVLLIYKVFEICLELKNL